MGIAYVTVGGQTGVRQRVDSLRAMIDDVVDADWGHPAWWALVWLAGIMESTGGRGAREDGFAYHGANGGPHSDTFMARPAPCPRSRIEMARWGAARARQALAAVEETDGRLPGQPLQVVLRWRGRWLEVQPASDDARRSVVFTARGRHYMTRIHRRESNDLARDLHTLFAGPPAPRFVPVPGVGPVDAVVGVCLDLHGPDVARHAHRMSWLRGSGRTGGPWMGIARTDRLELVTTCHLVVDGYGHTILTDRILGAPTPPVPGPDLEAETLTRLSPGRSPARLQSVSTGLAWSFVPGGLGRFTEQAYATGIALERFYGRGGHAQAPARHSPAFTVPVAPGGAEDPDRRRRRVVHGLLSVARRNGGFEPMSTFSQRLGPWLDRERNGEGILARISSAVAGGPLPRVLKHRSLSNHHGPRASIPSIEGLSGRARLSSIRLPRGEHVAPPLVAASLPVLLPNGNDPRGGVVLTLIHHPGGTTVTSFGTGWAGTDDGAERFLELWLRTLATVRESGWRPDPQHPDTTRESTPKPFTGTRRDP